MHIWKFKTGFTLLEIIIVISIVVVLGLVISVILVNSTGVYHQESARVSQGLNVNDALDGIRKNIKSAQSIAENYPIQSPTYASSGSVLILKLAAIDVSGNIIADVYDNFIYTVETTHLKEKVFADVLSSRKNSNQILAKNVTEIRFEYFNDTDQVISPIGAQKVKVTMILKQKAGIKDETQVATSEGYLKND